VAGEGSFTTQRLSPYEDGSPRHKFTFCVQVACRDRHLLEAMQMFLGQGSLRDLLAKQEGWQPTSIFEIRSIRGHRRATIPFAERFLLPCAKRDQYRRWKADLDAYLERHPARWGEGPSTCSVEGCELPVRGRGVCRRHYYQLTGY
jgi:hypothetical protein